MSQILARLFTFALLTSHSPFVLAEGFFFNTKTKQQLNQTQFFEQTALESILVFGEKHALPEGTEGYEDSIHHHRRQGDLYRAFGLHLREKGQGLNGAMEFFSHQDQGTINDYFNGIIRTRDAFLRAVGWPSSQPFDQYERQFVFPLHFYGWTYGINAPRALTKKIAQVGISGLSEDENRQLPPNFQVGNKKYFERFENIMGGHVPAEKLGRYFEAQSTWDDTMAWKALEITNRSSYPLIILVGEFHVEYGGGLPDRLKARSPNSTIHSLLQREFDSKEDFKSAEFYHPNYGNISDYVWVTFRNENP